MQHHTALLGEMLIHFLTVVLNADVAAAQQLACYSTPLSLARHLGPSVHDSHFKSLPYVVPNDCADGRANCPLCV